MLSEKEHGNTYAFMNDMAIWGLTENEHDRKLEKFQQVAKGWKLTFNNDKCTF